MTVMITATTFFFPSFLLFDDSFISLQTEQFLVHTVWGKKVGCREEKKRIIQIHEKQKFLFFPPDSWCCHFCSIPLSPRENESLSPIRDTRIFSPSKFFQYHLLLSDSSSHFHLFIHSSFFLKPKMFLSLSPSLCTADFSAQTSLMNFPFSLLPSFPS